MNGIKPLRQHLAEVESRGTALRRRTMRMTQAMPDMERQRLAVFADQIMQHYDGVRPQYAFVDDAGAVFDVIPVEDQQSVRAAGGVIAKPSSAPGSSSQGGGVPSSQGVGALTGTPDRFGNAQAAVHDTIPMRRSDLEMFERTMHHRRVPPPLAAPQGGEIVAPFVAGTEMHRHSLMQMPQTTNRGGYAHHSVYRIYIDTNPELAQVFALTQQWYVSGTQTNFDGTATITDPIQTVEFGAQCYPLLYNTSQPCLFIYTTRNGYNSTAPGGEGHGYYNLRAGTPFIQTNKLWGLGAALSPRSSVNGLQRYIGLGAWLNGGNWWIYANGVAPENAIGYYPASWWGDGSLMSTRAIRCDWGGEIASDVMADGGVLFPGMGSGHLATHKWRVASYIRDMLYYNPSNGVVGVPAPVAGSAGVDQSQLRQFPDIGYTAEAALYQSNWGRTLWYGGPGATYSSNATGNTLTINPPPP